MRSNKGALLLAFFAVFSAASCSKTGTFAAEIGDLNGTWQPDWSYRAGASMPKEKRHYTKEQFSWGTGTIILNTTFDIDLERDEPYVFEPGLGGFPVREITQPAKDTIAIRVYRGNLQAAFWDLTFVFHFVDKDTLWIESEDKTFATSSEYGKGALWRRLSGPGMERREE
jgi:hypothetical protein